MSVSAEIIDLLATDTLKFCSISSNDLVISCISHASALTRMLEASSGDSFDSRKKKNLCPEDGHHPDLGGASWGEWDWGNYYYLLQY